MACIRINPDNRGLLGRLFTTKSNFPDHYTYFFVNLGVS